MPNTPSGTPYVVSSDLVSTYPATSLSLANTLDTKLAAKAPSASPTFTGTVTLTGATVVGLPAVGITLVASSAFTAVSSVVVNNCFTTTYDNYLLDITAVATSGGYLSFRMRLAGADNSGTAYQSMRTGINNSGNADNTRYSLATSGNLTYVNTTRYAAIQARMFRPALASTTQFVTSGVGFDADETMTYGGYHNVATEYTGITLLAGAGTFTGAVRIFGLQNS